jgi:hypothetical protein
MTREELKREFNVVFFDPESSADNVIDWFYSKLEEKVQEMNGNQFKALLKWQDEKKELELKLEEKDKEIIGLIDEFKRVEELNSIGNNINLAKLKAADEVINLWDEHRKNNFRNNADTIENLWKALEHYKSLKP